MGKDDTGIQQIPHERVWEVYRLRCIITNKSYVGKGNAKKRWLAHQRQAKTEHRYHLHDAIRIYGADKFILTIEGTFTSEAEAYDFEKRIIDTEDLRHTGYNEAPGMQIHCDLDQVRVERALTVKDGWSKERREMQSKRYTGEGNPFFGKHHDNLTLSKIGRSVSANVMAHKKISKALTGHVTSATTRAKQSASSPTRNKTLEEAYGDERASEIKAKLKSTRPDQHGENHPRTKLTNMNVISIRERSVDRATDKLLALEYDVTERTIYKIRKGETWRHLLPDV